MNFLNLGCGVTFVHDSNWVNLDFCPVSTAVRKANIARRLPIPDCSTSLVYSSHFLEHIPRGSVGGFLSECFRVLEVGGVIRLVLPDLENMADEYLRMRRAGEHDKANFLVLEMVDQCVRTSPGGEMGRLYRALESSQDENVVRMGEYIKERVGETLQQAAELRGAADGMLRSKVRGIASAFMRRINELRIKLILCALPSIFREQNVSLASLGERHHWLWDFHQIRVALEAAGFARVTRQSADRSFVVGFPFHPLDINVDGCPRKGSSSMYIEAVKK